MEIPREASPDSHHKTRCNNCLPDSNDLARKFWHVNMRIKGKYPSFDTSSTPQLAADAVNHSAQASTLHQPALAHTHSVYGRADTTRLLTTAFTCITSLKKFWASVKELVKWDFRGNPKDPPRLRSPKDWDASVAPVSQVKSQHRW